MDVFVEAASPGLFPSEFIDTRNHTFYCDNVKMISSKGIFRGDNPLHYSVPLLLLQFSLFFISSNLVEFFLKPLKQSSIVGQIIGGMVLGPSLIGSNKTLSAIIFPTRGVFVLETIATFGIMIFTFMMGLKTDARMMIMPGRLAMLIGTSVVVFSTAVPLLVCFILKAKVPMEFSLAKSLPLLAVSQSVSAFQVIACLLTELKILNSDMGRLAMASSLFSDLIGLSMMSIGFAVSESQGVVSACVGAILSAVAMFVVIVFLLRPATLWFIRSATEKDSISESLTFYIFVAILVSAFVSEVIGQHYALGPMILGLVLPEGPPLGSAMVQKLETFVLGLMYPTFLAVCGLKTNIFSVGFRALWVIGLIFFVGLISKFAAVMVPAIYGNAPLQEAFVLSLVMNSKGIVELTIFNLWRYDGTISDQEFTVCVLLIVAVSATVTPLIRIFYDPYHQFIPMRRMTVQHGRRELDFKIAVCIFKQDSVPTIINLLEASTPAHESPVAVTAVVLVELVGRTTPMFVAFHPNHLQRTLEPSPSSSTSTSHYLPSAFQHYECNTEGKASVQIFTNMSYFDTMHVDIARIVLEKRANILIVPFHKQWGIDGTASCEIPSIRSMNQKLLESPPCSVGILIDRGPATGSFTILNSQSLFRVAVFFLGGPDDAECLAFAARMAWHDGVTVSVIRFLLFAQGNTRERRIDTELLDEYRHAHLGNDHFHYQEEVVKDSAGLAELIRALESSFDLIIVGRSHHRSPLLYGLEEWSECPELGVVGDLLAAPDVGSAASVLVVQQQRLGPQPVNLVPAAPQMLTEMDQVAREVPESARTRNDRISVSIERSGSRV